MKPFAIAISLIISSLPVAAGISSGLSGSSVIVVAVPEPKTVHVSLNMPADFVSVPIRIISDQKNTALAYEESRQAIETISQEVKKNGQFQTLMGIVSLSQHRGGFGISSGSWSQPAASAEIYLLVPLTKEYNDIFSAGAEAARFVDTLHFSEKVHCELGGLQLAVENPEQYRAKLLNSIAEEIKETRSALASQTVVKVEGLESSVMVRQADARNVELFLNYSLTITIDK